MDASRTTSETQPEDEFGVFGVEAEEATTPEAGEVVAQVSEEAVEERDGDRLVRIVDGALDRASNLAEVKAVLAGFSEVQLAFISQAAYELSTERARERGDVDQLIEDAFGFAFGTRDGLGVMPWVEGGILWAPGAKVGKGTNKHTCRFVRVKAEGVDSWVWEQPGVVRDEIRNHQEGTKVMMQSITTVVLPAGAAVDVITSDGVGQMCKAKRIDSYTYTGTELEKTETRRIKVGYHR